MFCVKTEMPLFLIEKLQEYVYGVYRICNKNIFSKLVFQMNFNLSWLTCIVSVSDLVSTDILSQVYW